MKNVLTAPSWEHRAEFLSAVARSRRLHGQWVTPPRTASALRRNLARFDSTTHKGYWVLTEAGELAGVININEIVGGAFRSGYLGYYAFVPHNGRGYMTAGLQAVIARAFRELHLHRLEANIQPRNRPSRRLAKRLGFRLEGFSPRYLKISGKWCDHERWALTVEDWKAASNLR
jgi:ribosomal-protein-alanine N-acetyltransferase